MPLFWKKKKITHYEHLAKKWVAKHKKTQEKLWYHHGGVLHDYLNGPKKFALSSLAGIILLVAPGSPIHTSSFAQQKEQPFKDLTKSESFLLDLASSIPQTVRPLTSDEEQKIGAILTKYAGFSVSAELSGIRLNTTYGIIGQEQHLYRYPGDTIENHFTTPQDAAQYAQYGIAPGLGAYGYFASSQTAMTPEDAAREKWYIAVQTFIAPGYDQHVAEYNKFFAFHKMLVVNPQNGKAVVADIADAGPSPWTGKQLGGSPELMHYLGRVDGAQRGPVLYFFIDDPSDSVPLGPIGL